MDKLFFLKPKESGSPKKPAGAKSSANQLAAMKTSGQRPLKHAEAQKASGSVATGSTAAAGASSSSHGGADPRQPSLLGETGARQQTAGIRSGSEKGDATTAKDPAAPKTTTFAERKGAARILQYIHENPNEELSEARKVSVEWARKILPAFVPAVREATGKRSLTRDDSQEENRVTPVAKRTKTHGTPKQLSFAEVAKDRIIIGVLDRNHPEGQIPRAQWRYVEAALALTTFQVLEENPGTPPSCQDAGWLQGHTKIVACDDERSVELYKAAISKLGEVYPGAKLEAVDFKDIPSRPRARVFVPITPSDPEQIIKLFKLCNPHLPCDKWKVVKLEEPRGATRQVVLLLTRESLEPIEKAAGIVSYGFGKVTIKVYRSDAEVDKNRVPDDMEVEREPTEEEEEDALLESSQSTTQSAAELTESFKKLYRERNNSESDSTLVNEELLDDENPPDKSSPL